MCLDPGLSVLHLTSSFPEHGVELVQWAPFGGGLVAGDRLRLYLCIVT